MPYYFLLFLATLSLLSGQLLRLPFFGVPQGLLITDCMVWLALIFWITKKALKHQLKIKKSALNLPLFLTCLWFLVSLIWGGLWLKLNFNALIFSAFFFLRFAGYAGIFYIAQDIKIKEKGKIFKSIIITLFILAIIGFLQVLFFPNLDTLTKFGWDPHQGRLVSTWLDPNFLGAGLVIGILLTIGQIIKFLHYPNPTKQLKKKRFYLYIFLLFIFFLAVILTFSRSAYLMLLISLSVLGAIKARKFILPCLLIFFLLLILIPRSRERLISAKNLDQSAQFRLESWQNTLEIAKKNFLTGVGFNAFRFAQEKYGKIISVSHSSTGSDSSFLLVLADAGMPGLLLFLWLYFSMLKSAWQKYKKKQSYLALSALAILSGLFFQTQFTNSLFYPHLMLVIWLILGVL